MFLTLITCSAKLLQLFYHDNGLSYRKMRYRIANRYTEGQKLHLQRLFSLNILEHLQLGREVIFIDESTSHSWNHVGALTWMFPDDPIHLPLAPSRGSSHAM